MVANANAALHNLLMLAVGFAGSKLSLKGLAPLVVPVLDLVCFRFDVLILIIWRKTSYQLSCS